MNSTAVSIIVLVVLAIMAITLMVLYIRNNSLEKIRKDVYQLILKAEHRYKESGKGKQKMEFVVNRARALLPKWLQVVITTDSLEWIIQKWFDSIKDLLDDGKLNQSQNNEEKEDGESDS